MKFHIIYISILLDMCFCSESNPNQIRTWFWVFWLYSLCFPHAQLAQWICHAIFYVSIQFLILSFLSLTKLKVTRIKRVLLVSFLSQIPQCPPNNEYSLNFIWQINCFLEENHTIWTFILTSKVLFLYMFCLLSFFKSLESRDYSLSLYWSTDNSLMIL